MLKKLGVSSSKQLFLVLFTFLLLILIIVTVSGLSSLRGLNPRADSNGPRSPTVLINTVLANCTDTNIDWVNAGNAASSDNSYAEATDTTVGQTCTNGLKTTGFGFGVPSEATINGIVVEVERRGSGLGSSDLALQLVKNGSPVGAVACGSSCGTIPTSDTYKTYGSPTYLWGTTWIPNDINSSQFGAIYRAILISGETVYVDHVRTTVYYSLPLPPPPTADIKANGSDGPISISYNTAATISWASTNASSCSVSPSGWTGTSGSQSSGNLTSSRTFTLSCSGAGGSAADAVVVNVGAPPPSAPTADIKANGSDGPISISYNTAAAISWTSTNATSCSVSPSGWTGTGGSQSTGNLVSSRTYTLNCSGSGGSGSDSVIVNVAAAPPVPTADIRANGTGGSISIAYAASATISWTSTNATSCSVSPSGWVGTSGSQSSGALTSSRIYTLSCSGAGGSASDSVTINVGAPPPSVPVPDIKANGSNGPVTINYNTSVTISWTSTNATSCSVSPGSLGGTSGSQNITLTSSTTYNISCSGAGGNGFDSVTVNVNQPGGNSSGNGNSQPPPPAQTQPNIPTSFVTSPQLPHSTSGGGSSGSTPTVSGIVNFLNLKLSLPYILGKTRLLFVIGSYSFELDAKASQTDYQIDLRGGNFAIGKEIELEMGGQNLLIRKAKISAKAQTETLDLGELAVGDLNNDNRINSEDKDLLLRSVGRSNGGDINNDGVTNSFDWAVFLKYNGKQGD